MESATLDRLQQLFKEHTGSEVRQTEVLPLSGSDRKYYRFWGGDHVLIGAVNADIQENNAFVAFSGHFRSCGLSVPEVLAYDEAQGVYLLEDLGDQTLLQYLFEQRKGDVFPDELTILYKKALRQLAEMQIEGGKGLDYNLCYPSQQFDKQSMLWDLNYFKYCFLRPSKIAFDEYQLESDFQRFVDYLLAAPSDYFMFRDFQARNIMIQAQDLYFIDYQGGRRGPLQYDLASLLYQARADLPEQTREELLDYYINEASTLTDIDKQSFRDYYYGFVLIRCMQVLGAYGFKGLYERKKHFIESIPYAVRNLDWLLKNTKLPIHIPYLIEVLRRLVSQELTPKQKKTLSKGEKLKVRITSFSYKKGGIPQDLSGNGGGFVFDCRFLHNPGRFEPYKKLTGRDESVKQFLKTKSNIDGFLKTVYSVVEPAVERYIERGFENLMVNFGCTGGQHRSVFSADALAAHLKEKYSVEVDLEHIEQEKKNWVN